MTDINETKLTAYALGECSPVEAAKVEAHLKANPDARQTVDEIRSVAGLLQNDLADEPKLTLTAKQREAIKSTTAKPHRRLHIGRKVAGIAAIFVMAAVAGGAVLP